MAHHRTTIRNALVAAFSSVTFTVYSERVQRLDETLRPAAILTLTATEEEASRRSMGWKVEHLQTVVIELHAHAANGLLVAEAQVV